MDNGVKQMEKSTTCRRLERIFDNTFGDRRFEVYSIAGGESLSEAMTFSAVCDELDSIAYGAGGVCNGMDIREVH